MTDETPAERCTRHMAERAALVAESAAAPQGNQGASQSVGGKAKADHHRRVDEERAHHLERLDWLSSPDPKWSCGTPVVPSDQRELLRLSVDWLSLHGRNPA